jgi:hypothetical protein
MGQTRSNGGVAKPQSYWDTIRERIDCAMAVDVVNKVMRGETVAEQRARYSFAVLNKLLPSMQAIAVQVEHKVAPNRDDLIARALSRGIDPAILFANHQAKPLITQDKLDSVPVDSEAPHPPVVAE